ncbi:unnamed protein product [Pedinophyceae sp. YPF-701]|nr:unnamed protein product [Pedinophyceae sp. YPF-701]
MTVLRVWRNSAPSAPMMMRWSAVRLTFIIFFTPIMPSSVATTVGFEPATARIAPVPSGSTASKDSTPNMPRFDSVKLELESVPARGHRKFVLVEAHQDARHRSRLLQHCGTRGVVSRQRHAQESRLTL